MSGSPPCGSGSFVANWRLSPLNRFSFFRLLVRRHAKAANAAKQISDARLSSQSTLMTG